MGWDLGSLRLENCHGGSLLLDVGSCFLRPPHGAVWRGRALGTSRWRYVAGHALMSLGTVSGRGGDGHVPLPNPAGCRGSPRSLLRAGKRVSRVLQHAVCCGTGQIQPHPGEEHGTGTEPAFPPSPGTLRQPGPTFPAPQLWGFVPHPIPAPLNHRGGTGVKSCPNLFLAVLQLGINGPGRAVGKCLSLRAQPLCSVACVKVSTANLHFFRNSLISQMTAVWSRALAAAPVPRP